MSKRQAFSPSCPSGGTWYACGTGTTNFVGCCARDPCTITCAQGDLYPAAFDPSFHGKFPDASCGIGSDFYTCIYSGQTPGSFMGCCKTPLNPCQQGSCPRGSLEPAILARQDQRDAYASSKEISIQSSTLLTSATSTLPTTTGSNTPTTTAGQTTVTVAADLGKKSPIAAIAGGAAGGAIVLAIVVGLMVYYFYYSKRSRDDHRDTIVGRLSVSDAPTTTIQETKQGPGSPPSDVPPGYSSPHLNAYSAFYDPYGNTQHANHAQQPQELPTQPLSIRPSVTRKALHVRGPSELSGEPSRSELESPLPAAGSQSQYSPHSTHSQYTPHSPRDSGSERYAGTTAHSSWQQPQRGSVQNSPAQGLGVWSEGQEMGQHPEIRGYPGV